MVGFEVLVYTLAVAAAGQQGNAEATETWSPVPPVVRPGEGSGPPSDAIVLFDGSDLSAWREPKWRIGEGAVTVVAEAGSLVTRSAFGDVQLHIEWRTPSEVVGEGQGRGNSGVFLMGRYEIQVLDSFENETYADGQCAAIYGQHPPLVNASRPPGEWQTYDLVFRAPRFEGGKLVSPATMTLLHNGVLVHDRAEILGTTVHQAEPRYEPHGPVGPLRLQDHGNTVRYRNVWVRRLP